jgi:superfamily II DNA or RNA helicase
VQTLNSGDENRKRMHRFKPEEFGLLVFDEAHHSTADTWLPSRNTS